MRSGMWLPILLLVLFATGLCASPVGAAEDTAKGPQIFTPVRIDLGIWTLVVFGILFIILKSYAWKPMLEGLQKREENINAAFDEARKAREEAQQLRDHLAQERARIAEDTRNAMDQARREGQRLVEEMTSKAKAEIQAERERLRREITMAKDQAIKELWTQTAQLATLVSAKVIRRELSPDDHHRLVDEALAELKQAGQERLREVAGMQA